MKKFEMPTLSIHPFQLADVLTTSGGQGWDGPEPGPSGDGGEESEIDW